MSRKNMISEVPQSEQITLELLKYQNKCLVSQRQDNLNQINSLQNEVKQLKLENKNHTSLYTNFWSSWRVFSIKLENINEVIKQETEGQQKLEQSFKKSFDMLLDIQNISEQVKTTNNQEFNKMTQSKCQDFVKQFETIYVQFQIEHKKYLDNLISKYEYYSQNTSIEDSLKKAYTDAIEAQNKVKELTNFLENEKYKFIDVQNNMELDQIYIKLEESEKKFDQEQQKNQILNRRIKIMSTYQNLNSMINKLVEDKNISNDLQQESYLCICGSHEIEPLLKEQIQHLQKIQSQLNSGQLIDQSTDKDVAINKENNINQTNTMEVEQVKSQNTMLSEQNESISANDKLVIQAKQIEELIDEKSGLQKQLKQIQMDQTNLDEQFINSKLFNNLCKQGEELILQNIKLKEQLNQQQQFINEIQRLREEEIREILLQNQQDFQKLKTDMENKMSFSKGNVQLIEKEIEQLMDKHQKSDTNKKIIELQEKLKSYEKQIFELVSFNQQLRLENKELQEKNNVHVEKIEQLKIEIGTLKSQFAPDATHIDLKYPKEKVNDVMKQYPQLKDFIKEMIGFMKQRDDKSNKSKKLNEQYQKDIKGLKSQIEQFYQEVDITQQGFDEKKKENLELEENLKNKENQLRSLEHEKVKEKMALQQEIEIYKTKIETNQQIYQSQNVSIEELQKQHQNLEKEKQMLQALNQEYSNQNQIFQEKLENLFQENQGYIEQLNLIQKVKDSGQIINEDLLKQKEKLEQQLKENNLVLKQNLDKLNNSQDEYLKFQLQDFKQKLNCVNCNEKQKEISLKCGHMFCKSCIEKNIKSRQRSCPTCRNKFDQKDIKDVYWN